MSEDTKNFRKIKGIMLPNEVRGNSFAVCWRNFLSFVRKKITPCASSAKAVGRGVLLYFFKGSTRRKASEKNIILHEGKKPSEHPKGQLTP
ncbi:MAG TPA: hypothetical protein VMT76_07900, partial [Puia sp.]|nr:hypothetical protein [Puia sp.]